MAFLRELRIRNFRNLGSVELKFTSQVNVIEGQNGSGKTSLLDAIHLLATGKPFSGGTPADFVSRGATETVVNGEVDCDGVVVRLGVEKSRLGTACRANGASVRSASSLMAYLPVISLDAQLYQLVSNSPAYRRSLIDRTLFHVEPDYLDLFKKFHRSMQHRNEAIRQRSSGSALEFWDEEFCSLGLAVDRRRQAGVAALNSFLSSMEPWAGAGAGTLRLEYRSGWRAGLSLREALSEGAEREKQWNMTLVGPQRAELRVTVDGVGAKQRVSRGQAKRIACLLVAAQLAYLEETSQVEPVLLVDDLSAELDQQAQRVVLETLLNGRRQTFVTAIDYEVLAKGKYLDNAQRFHVEHGNFLAQ